jgi:cytochrome c oxidase subunit 4
MSAHAEAEEHFAGSNRLFMSVWFWLLLLTGFEVFLGYVQLPVIYMLVILMGASIIKAALIVAYFMHLRFERLNLILTIVPALVICICLCWFSFRTVSARNIYVTRDRRPQLKNLERGKPGFSGSDDRWLK